MAGTACSAYSDCSSPAQPVYALAPDQAPNSAAARQEPVIDTTFIAVNPLWSTSSFGESADPTSQERSVLGAHLVRCYTLSGRLFPLQCLGEAMHGFVAPRLVTTLVVVAAMLIGVISLAS